MCIIDADADESSSSGMNSDDANNSDADDENDHDADDLILGTRNGNEVADDSTTKDLNLRDSLKK